MKSKTLGCGIFAILLCLLSASVARADQGPATTIPDARFESLSSDRLSVDVVTLSDGTVQHFLVSDPAVQNQLLALHKGDRLSARIVKNDGQTTLQTMSVRVVSVGARYRVFTILGAAAAFWFVCFLLSGFHPQKLIMGEDGRFSNSKFQTVLWFGVLVVSYLTAVWLRAHELGGDMLGGVNIPQNLFLLSGMSAVTFTAAKGITVTKIENAIAAGEVFKKPLATVARFWSDLTSNDSNQFDLGDFQMLIMTFLAVGTFVVLFFHFLGTLEARTIVYLPDVDTTILASFGLGHGAYLTKKAVGTLGDS